MMTMLSSGRRWASNRFDSAGRAARRHPATTASALAATLLAGLAAAFAPRLWRRRQAFGH